MSVDTHARNARHSTPPPPEVVAAAADLIERLTSMAETGSLVASQTHLLVMRAYLDGYRAGYEAAKAQP